QCPVCSVELVMSERQGVEIDYCPKCRGVWLDRGELDKIIEKSERSMTIQPTAPQVQPVSQGGHHGERYEYEYKKRKRKSFLHELFD
ncbi:MAG: zf-TFIIB domain-containing protein, partial [Deltaproteobacteria bacterium]|nr:zf-TFIIB domain-containing protein [Deltaproteobacteria bacterium]